MSGFEPTGIQPIIIKPNASSWEDLEKKLEQVINFLGVWTRAKQLYEQGYGAELETLADICLATHREKHPYQMFAASISKTKGNWEKITLKMVAATWEVRRNALTVIDKLKLKSDSTRRDPGARLAAQGHHPSVPVTGNRAGNRR